MIFNKLEDSYLKNYKITQIHSDGKRALDYILSEKIDVVLLDLNLPGMTGIEILECIKEKNINTNVIVISGEQSLMYKLISKKLDVYATFMKPLNADVLIGKLEEINLRLYKEEFGTSNKIEKILGNFNFNKTSFGYSYIIDSIEICINEGYKTIPIAKDLYQKVAIKNRMCSITHIKWNIDKAIKVMLKLTDSTIIKKYFKYDIPSTKNFLNFILSSVNQGL